MSRGLRQTAESRLRQTELTLHHSEHVLHAGTHLGLLALFAQRFRPGPSVLHLVEIDAAPAILATARRKDKRSGVSVRFEQGLAQSHPFPDASFDLTVSSLMFYHLRPQEMGAALTELMRVLRPAGRLLIADGGRASGRVRRIAFNLMRLLDGFAVTRDHAMGRFSARIENAGFSRVRTVETLPVTVDSIDLVQAEAPG